MLEGTELLRLVDSTSGAIAHTELTSTVTITNQNDLINALSFTQASGHRETSGQMFSCLQKAQGGDGQSCFDKTTTEAQCRQCCMNAGNSGKKLCRGGASGVAGQVANFFIDLFSIFFDHGCEESVSILEGECIANCRNKNPIVEPLP